VNPAHPQHLPSTSLYRQKPRKIFSLLQDPTKPLKRGRRYRTGGSYLKRGETVAAPSTGLEKRQRAGEVRSPAR